MKYPILAAIALTCLASTAEANPPQSFRSLQIERQSSFSRFTFERQRQPIFQPLFSSRVAIERQRFVQPAFVQRQVIVQQQVIQQPVVVHELRFVQPQVQYYVAPAPVVQPLRLQLQQSCPNCQPSPLIIR